MASTHPLLREQRSSAEAVALGASPAGRARRRRICRGDRDHSYCMGRAGPGAALGVLPWRSRPRREAELPQLAGPDVSVHGSIRGQELALGELYLHVWRRYQTTLVAAPKSFPGCLHPLMYTDRRSFLVADGNLDLYRTLAKPIAEVSLLRNIDL
jgi:hypothetical protein